MDQLLFFEIQWFSPYPLQEQEKESATVQGRNGEKIQQSYVYG
jgi:hypothetical protein